MLFPVIPQTEDILVSNKNLTNFLTTILLILETFKKKKRILILIFIIFRASN